MNSTFVVHKDVRWTSGFCIAVTNILNKFSNVWRLTNLILRNLSLKEITKYDNWTSPFTWKLMHFKQQTKISNPEDLRFVRKITVCITPISLGVFCFCSFSDFACSLSRRLKYEMLSDVLIKRRWFAPS